jgi:hypothetical protein
VRQPETLEVRSGDQLLPGKTGELVTAAGIKASEVISARGFVVSICGNARCGWVNRVGTNASGNAGQTDKIQNPR